MKKFMFLVLSVVLLLGIFAACGQQAPAPQAPAAPAPAPPPLTPPPPPGGDADESVTLTWAMWDAHLIPYYEALIEAYSEIAPHVTIELVDLGTADFETILQTHLIGGADYDLVKVRNAQAYVNKLVHELILPLDGFIAEAGFELSGFGGFDQNLRWEGSLYTLPIRRDHWVIFYNKDLFDKAGVPYPTNYMTTADFDALVREVGGALPDGYWGNLYHWWPSIVHLFGVVGGNTLVDGVYDWKIPYYEMVINHQLEGYAPSHVDLTVGNIHYSVPWYNGEGAMLNMGTWFIAMQLDAYEAGTSVVSNWGIVYYPVPEGIPHGTSPAGFTGLSIGRNSQHPQEAMDFIAFASGPLGAEIMVSVGQFPGMMTDAVVDRIVALDGFPQDAASRQALQPRALELEMPINPHAASANAIIGTAHTEIMTGNATIEEGIEMMNRQIGRDLMGLD